MNLRDLGSRLHEHFDDARIERTTRVGHDHLHHLIGVYRRPIRTPYRQGIVKIDDTADPRFDGNFLAGEAIRVTGPVPLFVVRQRNELPHLNDRRR